MNNECKMVVNCTVISSKSAGMMEPTMAKEMLTFEAVDGSSVMGAMSVGATWPVLRVKASPETVFNTG